MSVTIRGPCPQYDAPWRRFDDAYYEFILAGRREIDGVPMIGEDRLIPLKAVAWLELLARRTAGESIDSRNVRKHFIDVLRLSGLLIEDSAIAITGKVADDMKRFLAAAPAVEVDLGALGYKRTSLAELLARIGKAFAL